LSNNAAGADSNLEELLDISILLLAATTPAPSYPDSTNSSNSNEKSPTPPPSQLHFDFFLLHLLLSCHAVRVLFKNLPTTTQHTLLEAQFLATISYYVSELRPEVKLDLIQDHQSKGTDGTGALDWGYVRKQCLEVDVSVECTNGGNYVRGKTFLKEVSYGYSAAGVERSRDGIRI
jgi:hypothetical protein